MGPGKIGGQGAACRFCQILRPPPPPHLKATVGSQRRKIQKVLLLPKHTNNTSGEQRWAGGGANSDELLLVSSRIDGGGAQPERYKLAVKGSEAVETQCSSDFLPSLVLIPTLRELGGFTRPDVHLHLPLPQPQLPTTTTSTWSQVDTNHLFHSSQLDVEQSGPNSCSDKILVVTFKFSPPHVQHWTMMMFQKLSWDFWQQQPNTNISY